MVSNSIDDKIRLSFALAGMAKAGGSLFFWQDGQFWGENFFFIVLLDKICETEKSGRNDIYIQQFILKSTKLGV